MKRLLAILGALVIAVFLFARPALASSEAINNLEQKVVISKDSVATVTESIDYDFGTTPRHGIKRYYLLSSKNPEGKYYNLNFKLVSISQDGEPANFQDQQSGNNYYIKVGSSNLTITGVHHYTITYKMWPVVRQDPAGDYINYNVTGNDWEVPILKASASITLPTGTTVTQARCYTGSTGSTQQNCTYSGEQEQYSFVSNVVLEPGEGFTINMLTPSSSFTNYLTPSNNPKYVDDTILLWGAGIGIGLLFILIGCLIRLVKWLNKRKSEKAETIIAQYEPPDGLLPAEMGVLEDLKLDITEITATIIDLAVKGYMKIRRVKDSKGYEFVILKEDTSALQDYEKEMMDLFSSSAASQKEGKVLDITTLDKSKASKTISSAYTHIDSRLRDKKFYSKKINPSAKGAGIVGVVVLIFIIPFFVGFSFLLWFLFPLICLIVGLALARTPGHMTKAGYNEWAKVEGLKLYLTVAEKDRIKFHDAPKKNPELFSKLLPSAIALKVEKEWAKQFEGMDISKSVDWYDDYDPITPIYMTSILSDSFSSSLSSSFAPPTSTGSSSGGFSGGGFSGGGSFGGGGGGSW